MINAETLAAEHPDGFRVLTRAQANRCMYGLVYVATPYHHRITTRAGRVEWKQANYMARLAASEVICLAIDGLAGVSPVVLAHQGLSARLKRGDDQAEVEEMALDQDFWVNWRQDILDVSACVWVPAIWSREKSHGILHAIGQTLEAGRPVYWEAGEMKETSA